MLSNRPPVGDVTAVRIDNVPMAGLELLNFFRHPKLVEMDAVHV